MIFPMKEATLLKLPEAITAFAADFRSRVEPAWNQATISEDYTFKPENPSVGQCAPTSQVFCREMRQYFPHLPPLRLIVGNLVIPNNSEQSIPETFNHVWAALRFASGGNYVVFDFTGDQAENVHDKIIIGLQPELEQNGIKYGPYSEFKGRNIITRKLLEMRVGPKARILRNRMRPPSPEVLQLVQQYNRSISPKKS